MSQRLLPALGVLLLPATANAPHQPPAILAARAGEVEMVVRSIARHEGWGSPNSLVRTLHNPGALVYVRQAGSRPGPQGYAVFDDDATGWTALRSDVTAKFRLGINLRDLMRLWCGGCYLDSLLEETGLHAEWRGSP
jgi:hypothetical protein